MFGQEPRLPVDFLLGGVQEVMADNVHDLILDHQTRLQVAFESARERLKVVTVRHIMIRMCCVHHWRRANWFTYVSVA